jgi:hypothetical protein
MRLRAALLPSCVMFVSRLHTLKGVCAYLHVVHHVHDAERAPAQLLAGVDGQVWYPGVHAEDVTKIQRVTERATCSAAQPQKPLLRLKWKGGGRGPGGRGLMLWLLQLFLLLMLLSLLI